MPHFNGSTSGYMILEAVDNETLYSLNCIAFFWPLFNNVEVENFSYQNGLLTSEKANY